MLKNFFSRVSKFHILQWLRSARNFLTVLFCKQFVSLMDILSIKGVYIGLLSWGQKGFVWPLIIFRYEDYFVNHVQTCFRCFGQKVIITPSLSAKTQLNQVWNNSDKSKITILNRCLLLKRLLNYIVCAVILSKDY